MRVEAINLHQYNRVANKQANNKINAQSVSAEMYPSIAQLPIMPLNYMANVSFKGINPDRAVEFTTEMGKRIFSKRHVTNLSKTYSDAGGITLGRGIPEEWTSRIPNLEEFDQFSFMEEFGKAMSKERKYADADRLRDELAQLFMKHHIIDADTPFSVRYIGHGFQAWAYRIGIGTDESTGVVAKLFKRNNNYLQNHGNHTEQNLAEYVKEYAGDSPLFVKYYYGDTKNGYMLTKFIKRIGGEVDGNQKASISADLEDFGLSYDDAYLKNIINDEISDFGGLITASNLIGNKTAQGVHSAIKYAETPEERVEIFNRIFSEKADTDEFKDKAIGLVHAIKFMPKEMQAELYNKCHSIGSHRVNIALIQNFKNFGYDKSLEQLTQTILDNAHVDPKELENIAKFVKSISGNWAHRFFEAMQDTKISAIIKYLARNINLYYKDMPMRVTIYDKFITNSDNYAAVALINNMNNMSASRYDGYFERFFAKNDDMVNTSLARSLNLFNEDPRTQEKWMEKLFGCDSENVYAGLAEVLRYMNDDAVKVKLFKKLLEVDDRVTKEFLAQNILYVPGIKDHPEYIERLMDGADNMLRGALIKSMEDLHDTHMKARWIRIIREGADNTINRILDKISETNV